MAREGSFAEGALQADDGVGLHWRSWEPAEPSARVLVVHGVGEHGGRYEGFAGRLASRSVACTVFDQRGHGRSGGRRGHVARWSRYLRDVEQVVGEVMGSEACPLYLFGHSMGALIGLSLAIEGSARRMGVAGIVSSGASIRPSGVAKPHLVMLARVLSRVAPWVAVDLGIESSWLSHEPEVVAAYDEDPAIVRKVTARWGTEILQALDRIRAEAGRIRDPLLVLHGGADPLAEASGSRWLHETVAGPSELIVYENALHEPHNDPGFADVVGDVVTWIRSHQSAEAGAAPLFMGEPNGEVRLDPTN